MSRYALEWAKEKRPATADAKILLLVLGDYADGMNHACTINEGRLCGDTGFSKTDLSVAFQSLKAEGLIVAEIIPRPTTDHVGGKLFRARAIEMWGENWSISLCIPSDWRARRRGKRLAGWEGKCAQRTAVYRLYDESESLLYVGISDRPLKRFKQHRQKQPWWPEVITREIEWHEDRHAAEVEEFRAITHENPRYNVQHAVRRSEP